MEIKRIAVIGAGTMGRGIAEVAAVAGLDVLIVEVSESQRKLSQTQVRKSIEQGVRAGKIFAGGGSGTTADAAAAADVISSRIIWTDDIDAAAMTKFVIEAVPEEESLKLDVFSRLDGVCPPTAILASNTSSISLTRLASATGRPDRVVGMHFFNPVPMMAPVEIVRAATTSEDTVETTRRLAEQMGKQAFVVQGRPGFVVNRVLMPLINEAAIALHEGVADAVTIDGLMKLGCNHPMGPLRLADLVGLDVCVSILHVLHRELGDKFCPCPLLIDMVQAGKLGRKSGEGFYKY
ncbi:MAG: 3-hydroxybutyryl-CoA dehydrogenase [Planctomycetales bacterium]|nr:3-hydroxybutyryl-CoA dehydrogenase [Planctomycetales bacterium]